MTKRANHPSDLADPFYEPIVEPIWAEALMRDQFRACPAALEAIRKEVEELVTNQKIEKLRLLPDRYKIDPKSDTLWLFICFRLAEEFVPGFKVVLHAPKGPGAPRKSYIDLVQAVEFLVAVGTRTGERISVLGACKKLSSQRGPWYEKGPKTLETRYYECRAKLAQHRGIVETDLIRRLERAAKAAMA